MTKKNRTINEYRQSKDFGYVNPVKKDVEYTDNDIEEMAIDYAVSESYGGSINGDLWKGFIFGFKKAKELYGK